MLKKAGRLPRPAFFKKEKVSLVFAVFGIFDSDVTDRTVFQHFFDGFVQHIEQFIVDCPEKDKLKTIIQIMVT